MNIVNERIQHIAFGEGTVISHLNGRLSIEFSDQYGIKQFIYPDAFEKYLKLCNRDFQLSVLEDLNEKRARIEAERLRIHQEQEEAHRLMIEKIKLEAKKKKATPKSKKSTSKSKSDSTVSQISEDNED